MTDYTATYSPEDNKLRLYATTRLDSETYAEAKRVGFRWAPKQELFYTHWSPAAEDWLIALAGEIGDEDKSLADRAAERAERFEGYSEKRAADADAAFNQVKEITNNIPLGQPILVGHHSEKRARKDAERIERGMQKAIKTWETSKYWEYRAKGVIQSADYKDRADVRARRIKKLEAENRKYKKNIDNCETLIKLWSSDKLTREKALQIANRLDHASFCFTLEKYPRTEHTYEGMQSLWSALEDGIIDHEQARDLTIPLKRRSIARNTRLYNHNARRLNYEKAILEAQGAKDLLKPKARPKQPPLLNYRAPDGLEIPNRYHSGQIDHYMQIEMTKAEYAKIHADYKGTRHVNGHRVRVAMTRDPESGLSLRAVFLIDSKEHPRPDTAPHNLAEAG